MRRALSLAVIGATVLGGTVTCRAEYGPPIVFNCSTTPVRVSIVRPDRKRISVSVKPQSAPWQPLPGSAIESINSSSSSAVRGQRELNRIRHDRPVREELWVVTPRGLDLVDLSELRNVRNRCSSFTKRNPVLEYPSAS